MESVSPSPSRIEPGLLPVFRLFTALRLGLVLLALVAGALIRRPEVQLPSLYFGMAVIEAALLLVYISLPGLEKRLGGWYLPLALLWATLLPILEQSVGLYTAISQDAFGPRQELLVLSSWQLLPVLFVPLILIAWQYSLRWVVLFGVGTAALELVLAGSQLGAADLRLYILASMVFMRTVTLMMVGYMVSRLMKGQRTQRRALAEANSRLAHYAVTLEELATSRERNRLARELHDTLAHTLSGLAVQMEAVEALWEADPAQAHAMVSQAHQATRSGLTETRRALQALRASPLEDLGLLLALRELAESTATRAGFTLEVDLPAALTSLPPDVEQTIYRVTQEALQNAAKYAGAQRVSLALEQRPQDLTLRVTDDGAGFDPQTLNGQPPEHLGLRGMRERAEVAGGSLEINSQPGRGTVVVLQVPL
jgi:signal transduction histidine kinase